MNLGWLQNREEGETKPTAGIKRLALGTLFDFLGL